jgi:hypothetical protein
MKILLVRASFKNYYKKGFHFYSLEKRSPFNILSIKVSKMIESKDRYEIKV